MTIYKSKKIWTKDRNRPVFLLSRLLLNKEGRLPFSRPDPTGTLVYTDVVIDKRKRKKKTQEIRHEFRAPAYVGPAGIRLSHYS